MSHTHEMVQCSVCHTIVAQCRCIGPKTIKYITCDSCLRAAGRAANHLFPEGQASIRIIQTKAILSEWASLQGHARCHNHNEVLLRLCHLLGVPVSSSQRNEGLPKDRLEFRAGCEAFENFLYDQEGEHGNKDI